MLEKISVFGAGGVGAASVFALARRHLTREIVLVDLDDDYARGVALDIQQTAPAEGFDTKIIGTSDVGRIQNSQIVVIAAGLPRKPGMDRADVLAANVKIIDQVMDTIMKHAPKSYVIVVSNPVDALTYYALRKTGWARQRIIGQAGVLDSLRMKIFIAEKTGFSVDDIHALVLGGHGDTMVALPRFTTIGGVAVAQFLDDATLGEIIRRTQNGGAEVLGLKKKSSAYDAPGAAVSMMVAAIAHDQRRLMPCVSLLNGEYGEHDLAIGVPVVLGKNGAEEIIELDFNNEERAAFCASADATRKIIAEIPKHYFKG